MVNCFVIMRICVFFFVYQARLYEKEAVLEIFLYIDAY